MEAKTLYAWSLVFFGFVVHVHAQEKPDAAVLVARLEDELNQIVADDGFPGATLAVVLKDGTTVDISSGFEDPQAKKKMAVGSKMFCGSTGKTFVSAVALQLVAEGTQTEHFQMYDGLPRQPSKAVETRGDGLTTSSGHASSDSRRLFGPRNRDIGPTN